MPSLRWVWMSILIGVLLTPAAGYHHAEGAASAGTPPMTSNAGCDSPQGAGSPIRLDERSNGHDICLRIHQAFEIRLPENPTTGYRWMIESTGDPTWALTADRYDAASSALGASGVRTLRFIGSAAGRGRIELRYRRPWQQAAPSDRAFILHIRVLP